MSRLVDVLIIPAIAILLMATNTFAATYYIDYAGGSDSNNGTATNTPWKRHPWMRGSLVSGYSHSAGDRFIFKGGVTWPNAALPITVQSGGTAAVSDYYGVAQNWYAGALWSRPVFDAAGSAMTPNQFVYQYGINYIDYDNLEMKNYYWVSGYGNSFIRIQTGTWINIANCYFHDWTHPTYAAGGRDDLQVILGADNIDVTVTNCVFDGGPNNNISGASGMCVYQVRNVRNSIARNVSNGFLVGPNSEVSGCDIGPIYHSFSGLIVGNNQYHENSVETLGNGFCRVFNNYIHDELPDGAPGAVCTIFGNPGDQLYFYNNVVWNNYDITIKLSPSSIQCYIWNNTFINQTVLYGSGGAPTADFRNNHLINSSLGANGVAMTANANNLSQTTAQAAAAGYVQANFWQPTNAASPTVNVGSSYPSTTFTADILGRTRSTWDIGAYEYVSGGASANLPPTVSSIVAASWYVDNAAGGANNGTSWPDAWKSLSVIAWASVKAGDTIYISGGATSKTYNETLTVGAGGNSTNRLTITVGRESGHSGKVIIDAQNSRAACVSLGSRSYMTLSGNNGAGATNLVLRNAAISISRFTGVGIDSAGSTGNVIEQLEVGDCNNGMNLEGGSVTVRNCYLHGIRGDRAVILGGNDVYDNCIVANCDIQLNRDTTGQGPDGIQGGSGITVRDCHIYSAVGTVVSGQHMDACQTIGNHWKIYNNLVEDMGNACVEGGSVGSSWNNYLVYNNVWALTYDVSGSYMRGFEFTPNSTIGTVSNIYILNNTCVDLNYRTFNWAWLGQNPHIVNVVIQNNIFYDCARDVGDVVNIEATSATVQSDYNVDYNVINAGGSGKTAVNIDGSALVQAHPRTGVPAFVTYTIRTPSNDVHLKSTDTACKDVGTNMSGWIPAVDKDGASRPQGSAWDIGAYEYLGGAASTNLPPTVSAIGHNATDINTVTPGLQVLAGTSVQFSGSASDPNGNPLTWQWIYTINGGPEVVLGSGSGVVTAASFTFPGAAGGSNYVWKLRASDGLAASESQLTIGVQSPPVVVGDLVFQAESGVVTSPFVVTAGYISQPSQTSVTTGGRAAYTFTITNAGNYVIQAVVNAPGDSANSFYVNMDAEPQDPAMVWQIPVTASFENRIVNWQGSGTYDNPQYVPQVFNLTLGSHQLIIRGREAGAQLDKISILMLPTPPLDFRILP